MKKSTARMLALTALVAVVMGGCGQNQENSLMETENANTEDKKQTITVGDEIMELEDGLSVVRFDGAYGFEDFLAAGGARNDNEVVSFLTDQVLTGIKDLVWDGLPFGCSTLSVENVEGGYLFGRNFDWNTCDTRIVKSKPDTGYASVATVNLDFINAGGVDLSALPDSIQAMIALYAPLDGMNEQGFAVSVNMIEDSVTIEQNTEKPDLTTTTAIRLLLNQAATVDEAVALLEQYDLHASMGMMVHFAMADASGKSVVVEYVDHEMIVTETPVVTNFYLAEGSRYGIGSSESHKRYDLLEQTLKENAVMTEGDVRDAMDSVSKDDFNEFLSTEWTIIMNQETMELTYYHRENYEKGYTIAVE